MKKTYLVAEGVTEINGAPVPVNRRVELTDAEALYDLAHDRLQLQTKGKASPEAA